MQTTRAWKAMHQRCYNSNCHKYSDYGARGIKVCERWHEYDNFLLDMGKRPVGDYSLDRKDNDGDYSPENCRWTDPYTQAHNRRDRKDSNSGIQGVSFDKVKNKWQARIARYGVRISLGYHRNLFDAACARKSAENKHKP